MNNNEELINKRNKMGTMPVGRLLFTMSVPLVVSMLVQAMYNVVDSYFVAKLSNAALNAVSLAYPLQMLMISFAVGTGVGMNSYIARCLGMEEKERADRGASNGLFLLFITGAVFLIMGFFVTPFFKLFTDDPELIDLGVRYLRICMVFGMGLFIQIGCERILQSMGKTGLSMFAQLAGAIVNIVLDPMLIFGIGPFPELGIEGAAYATVIGQWIGMTIALLLVFAGKHEVKVSFRHFRPDGRTIGEIYRVGAPSIIMQSIGSLMTIGLNAIFARILASEIGVTITGVYFKLQSIIFMPLFGANNAAMSIMAYNYGAGRRSRFTSTFIKTLITALVIMFVGVQNNLAALPNSGYRHHHFKHLPSAWQGHTQHDDVPLPPDLRAASCGPGACAHLPSGGLRMVGVLHRRVCFGNLRCDIPQEGVEGAYFRTRALALGIQRLSPGRLPPGLYPKT